jgi:hypothetical protein
MKAQAESQRASDVAALILGRTHEEWQHSVTSRATQDTLSGALFMARGEDSTYLGWLCESLRACKEHKHQALAA